jgi:CHAT domain-containing protein
LQLSRSFKYIILYAALLFWLNGFSQCPTHESFTKQVNDLLHNKKLANAQLRNGLYALYKTAQDCRLTKDSTYVLLLIKFGISEFITKMDYASAIRYTLDALHVNHSLKDKESSELSNTAYSNLAFYYQGINFYGQALAYYDSLILSSKAAGTSATEARMYKITIYLALGDQQKCVEESTIAMAEAAEMRDSLLYISFLNSKAQSLCFLNNLSLARAGVQAVIALAQKYSSSYELAAAYLTNAFICEKENRLAEAEESYKKAIHFRKQSNELNTIAAIASDYNDAGNFYLNYLHNYSKAISRYNKSFYYAEHIESPLAATYNFARINISKGKWNLQQHKLLQALNNYKDGLGSLGVKVADFLNQNPTANQFELVADKELAFEIMNDKVQILLQLFRGTNNQQYLQSCLNTCRLLDLVITQIRHEQTGEQSKLNWREKTRDFFTNAIEASYLAGNTSMAFYFMEKSRAVLLNDKLNETGALAHLPPVEAAKEENLQIRIAEEQQRLSALNPSSKEFENEQYHFIQAKGELEKYIKSLETRYPVYHLYKYADSVPSLNQLQQYLAINKLSFVHYYTSDTAMYALAIMPHTTKFIKVDAHSFDRRQLTDFISLCNNEEALNSHYTSFAALAKNIYTKLFESLQLPKGNVAICTDNFFIPFEALCSDANGKQFLLYDYNFSYVYAARSLLKSYPKNAIKGNFIGFAPVAFMPHLQLPPLLQSADSLTKAAHFYSHTKLLIKGQATKSSFFRNAFHYSVITIFSHAQADTSYHEPLLYMQDSAIHLSELQYLRKVSSQFVLLSACQTNIGKPATGEGIFSLARGFASVGIPAVAATLWKADENSVYTISGKLNEYLAEGMNKSEALKKAKIWFLYNNDKAHQLPYYWANMVLIGSTKPVNLIKEHYSWLWIILITIITADMLINIAVLLKRTGYFSRNSTGILLEEQFNPN